MMRIELDSVRKDQNKSEWRMVNRARVVWPQSRATVQSVGDGNNIRSVCRALVEMGVSGEAEVFRGKTPVFSQPIDIEQFAQGKWGRGEQPAHLGRHSGEAG